MTTSRQSRSSTKYPLASIAAYGPDNRLATKLVAAVIERPGQQEAFAMKSWTTNDTDVRHDPTVAASVAAFVREHGVKDTVTTDRIIGCPHQEGIDYPMGRACPRCPFWIGLDRFTHEPLSPPVPTMSPLQVLEELSRERSDQPHEALTSADGHRDALVGPLLKALERGIAAPSDASEEDGLLFAYALYLFARWREPRAYPAVIRWLSLPGEGPFDIAGDVVTDHGDRILAAVFDGDFGPIKDLVLNRHANEYGRGAAVSAFARLAAWAEVPRDPVVSYFRWVAQEGLEREAGQVWNGLAAACVDIEAVEVFPDLRRAFSEGLVDPQYMAPSELDTVEAEPRGEMLAEIRERYPPIDDVAEATAWWAEFNQTRDRADRVEPYRAPPKIGRNDPCPCGSGRRYKKCCAQTVN